MAGRDGEVGRGLPGVAACPLLQLDDGTLDSGEVVHDELIGIGQVDLTGGKAAKLLKLPDAPVEGFRVPAQLGKLARHRAVLPGHLSDQGVAEPGPFAEGVGQPRDVGERVFERANALLKRGLRRLGSAGLAAGASFLKTTVFRRLTERSVRHPAN